MATIFGTSGNDTITPTGVSPGVTGGIPSDEADSILGGSGADTLDGGGGDDSLQGQGGDDVVEGALGDDRLGGNGGDDALIGANGHDRLFGHGGNDWLVGGAGNDRLTGDVPVWFSRGHSPGDDILDGGAGDDRLVGFGGADTYVGGGGNDVIAIHDADFASIDGGDGIDKLNLAARGFNFDFTSALGDGVVGIETLDLRGGDHAVTLDADSVLALGSETGKLKITGGSHWLFLSGGFAPSGQAVRGATTFDIYTAGEAEVWVDETINVNAGIGVIDLADLDGGNGFTLNGIDEDDTSGGSVSGAGDVNGDGIDDLIIGALRADPDSRPNAGESYVVFGSGAPFDASIELSSLDGTNGFVINGINVDDGSGSSVSGTGDFNGDGFGDLIISAPGADPDGKFRAGQSYVVFGSGDPFDAAIDLAALDGANGFTLNGIDAYDGFGRSVSGAGDVNGDGFDDVIIGAPRGGPLGGASYVVFGSGDPFDAVIEPAKLDGTNGFVINDAEVQGGAAIVSGAGDVNGDGYDDVIIGAPAADPNGRESAGASYVVFGSGDPFAAVVELADLDGGNGFVLNGIDGGSFPRHGDRSGSAVSGAGDVNGDGYDDVIIGASAADEAGPFSRGESYVVFGSGDPFPASIELADLDGGNGFVLKGIDRDDRAGWSVSGAGDVNGDGYDDVIVGAFRADANGLLDAGESYVVFGSGDPFDAVLELSDLDGGNGFVVNGIDAKDLSGGSVSGAGDVNGDGYDDLIIGAYFADPNGVQDAGESYVVFGGESIGAGGALAVDLGAGLGMDTDPLLL